MSLRKRLSRESGISTVIVVVSLLGIFGAVLLSLDAGNMWQTRRNVISATDATALDVARWASANSATGGDCSGGALLRANGTFFANASAPSSLVGCRIVPSSTISGAGYVEIEGTKQAETRFGGLFGLGNTNPYSFSAARYGYALAVQGLRPIGICDQNDHYRSWASGGATPDSGTHPVYVGAPNPVHRITYTKDTPEECGTAVPGNWGWQDFDGGDNSQNTLINWIIDGYSGFVGTNDCDADGSQPGGETGDNCSGDTGAAASQNQNCNRNTVAGALSCLLSTESNLRDPFFIVIFDQANCTPVQNPNDEPGGGGNNCSFHVIDFLGVRLWGFDVTGSQGQGQGRGSAASQPYFDLEFIRSTGSGICCSNTQTNVRVVQLCAVDHDSQGITSTNRCGQ